MPTSNALRKKQKQEMQPLIEKLDELRGDETFMSLAARSGLTYYQVGRILGDSLPAPTYLDITKLLRALGMSPNEAARLVGLYDDDDQKQGEEKFLSLPERRILRLVRRNKLSPTQLDLLAQVVEATARGLEGQARLEEHGALVTQPPSRRSASPRKATIP